MIRAAAKNHEDVAVLVDGDDYDDVLAALAGGGTTQTAPSLGAKSLCRTAAYDAAISNWMAAELDIDMPPYRAFGGKLNQLYAMAKTRTSKPVFMPVTRRAKGSRQRGKFKARRCLSIISMTRMPLLNWSASLTLRLLPAPLSNTPIRVVSRWATRRLMLLPKRCAAIRFGFWRHYRHESKLDAATATAITDIFTEVIIAPDADEAACEIIAGKKNLRLLLSDGLPAPHDGGLSVRNVAGGYLVQNRDNGHIDVGDVSCVTKRQPSAAEMADLLFAWQVAKHVKSNAIVYVKEQATVGIGAGQMSRLDSSRIAARKSIDAAEACGAAAPLAEGSVVASDAFFPFADGLLSAAEAGATAIIQPGGSIRDEEVIAAADDAGLAMLFTGMRHFRH